MVVIVLAIGSGPKWARKPYYTLLLTNALNFTNEITDIRKEDIQIMHHARKSLLFSNEKSWMKREGNLFDVTTVA